MGQGVERRLWRVVENMPGSLMGDLGTFEERGLGENMVRGFNWALGTFGTMGCLWMEIHVCMCPLEQ